MATKHLLTAWGFNEAVIDNFVAQEIEIEQFNNLTEEDLKILIPNIGPRRKFQANLKKYFDEIAQQPIEVNLIEREDLDLQESKKIKLDDLDVQDLDLQENKKIKLDDIIPPNSPSASSTSASTGYEGKNIINLFILLSNAPTADIKPAADNKYVKKKLNNNLRNKLAKIIVSNELSPNIHSTITSERACFLSEQLIRLFPTEDKNVWHIKNKKGESQGRGKILTKYYCIRRKLNKAGLLHVKSTTDFVHVPSDNEENDDNYEENILWLKNNCKPWQTVTEYWSLTSKMRLKALQSNNQSCNEYMIQFPALFDPLGYVLLEKDFETLYPNCTLKLYAAWKKISNFVISKVPSKVKNRLDNVSTPGKIFIVSFHTQ
ncbi:uncharacterized protein LOC120358849 [Solenopsis invicta]|uniref:uncharacterized protein LOC120358849 n=1 Tax=Solenopsis invicta TaxID=13686 RepID=UPI00193D6E66|nr:uncharacterized protein LOC120358849 [Solenopsis invicta]